MSNIYSALLDVLQYPTTVAPVLLFGTVSSYDPLIVRVEGREVQEELLYPRGTRYAKEDLGREVALLPCAEGLLLLCQVEGGIR